MLGHRDVLAVAELQRLLDVPALPEPHRDTRSDGCAHDAARAVAVSQAGKALEELQVPPHQRTLPAGAHTAEPGERACHLAVRARGGRIHGRAFIHQGVPRWAHGHDRCHLRLCRLRLLLHQGQAGRRAPRRIHDTPHDLLVQHTLLPHASAVLRGLCRCPLGIRPRWLGVGSDRRGRRGLHPQIGALRAALEHACERKACGQRASCVRPGGEGAESGWRLAFWWNSVVRAAARSSHAFPPLSSAATQVLFPGRMRIFLLRSVCRHRGRTPACVGPVALPSSRGDAGTSSRL
mmetsp:Transcript_53047/g.119529  ORF Transcript_53047/g.119529 Transcript_53047/m.119529 type:complete len:292 (-) Transcript_53047:233-1108(-)